MQPDTLHTTSKNIRIEYIDTLRSIACFLVILTHSTRSTDNLSLGIYLASISFIASPNNNLFMSISGALLLPVRQSMGEFYKRRFLKLIPPVAFWSVVILLLKYCTHKLDFTHLLQKILLLPLFPAHGVYWFIYVISGLYLLAPIISFWLKNCTKRQLEFVLLLWLFNMLIPYLNLLPIDSKFTNDSHYWMLNYFSGFLGYWILGYYLRYYPISKGCRIVVYIGSLVYIITLLLLKHHGYNAGSYLDNLQIGNTCLVTVITTFVQSHPIKFKWIKSIVSEIAKYSFGIISVP